jgi:hypothetical protein
MARVMSFLVCCCKATLQPLAVVLQVVACSTLLHNKQQYLDNLPTIFQLWYSCCMPVFVKAAMRSRAAVTRPKPVASLVCFV